MFDNFDRYVHVRRYMIILKELVSIYAVKISYAEYNFTFKSRLSVIFLDTVGL